MFTRQFREKMDMGKSKEREVVNEPVATREEPHIEYDAEQLDDVQVSKMRVQAERCRVEGREVDGLFRTRTGVLNFAEIDTAADALSRAASKLRRMVAAARVGMLMLAILLLAGCCGTDIGCNNGHDTPAAKEHATQAYEAVTGETVPRTQCYIDADGKRVCK